MIRFTYFNGKLHVNNKPASCEVDEILLFDMPYNNKTIAKIFNHKKTEYLPINKGKTKIPEVFKGHSHICVSVILIGESQIESNAIVIKMKGA